MVNHSKIGKKSKRKGKTYERRCAKLLMEFTSINFRSTPGSGGFNKQGTTIREELFCGDLICDDHRFKYCIEAKNREEFSWTAILKNPEKASFTKWWHQAVEDAKTVKLQPLLFFKPNIKDDFIVMADAHWKELYNAKCPHFHLDCYDKELELTIDGSSTLVTLPNAVMVDWKQFVKYNKADLMFEV